MSSHAAPDPVATIAAPRAAVPRGWPIAGLAIAAALAALALIALPFDHVVSDAARIGPAEGESLLWRAVQPVKLFGKGEVLIVLTALFAIHGRRRLALEMLLAMAIAGIVAQPIKYSVRRQRPEEHGKTWAFPSGDTAAAAAFATPLVAAAPILAGPAALAIAGIAAARVVTGYHFPSDVLAGAAIGVLAGLAARRARVDPPARWRRYMRHPLAIGALAAVAGVRLAVSSGDLNDFARLFGPAVAIVAVAPWVRARWRRRARMRPIEAMTTVPQTQATGRSAVLVAIVAMAILLLAAGRATLWDRDEPRFARATVEMIASKNLLVPTFNQEFRPDKPILIYWLMALPVWLLGPLEIACRLWAPIGAGLAILLTARIGGRLLGARAGATAAVMLAASPLLLVSGTAATTDAVLLATIAACFIPIEAALREGPSWPRGLALGAMMGLAQLVKGPVGLAVPLLGALAALRFSREKTPPGSGRAWAFFLGGASLLGLAMFAAWGLPANTASGGRLLGEGLWKHVFERGWHANDGHGFELSDLRYLELLPIYLPIAIVASFPWTLLLPAGISAAAGGRVGGARGRALLLGWIVPVFIVFSLYATKLPHYILPAFPAMAIAAAGALEAAEAGLLSPRDWAWMARGRWIFGALGLSAAAAMAIAPRFIPDLARPAPGNDAWGPGLADACLSIGAALGALTIIALKDARALRLRAALAHGVAGLLAVALAIVLFALPLVERFKLSKPLADLIRARVPGSTPIALDDYDEPSLIFYLGRERCEEVPDQAAALAWTRRSGPGAIVMTRARREEIQALGGSVADLVEIAGARGYNYTKGRWVDVVVLAKPLR